MLVKMLIVLSAVLTTTAAFAAEWSWQWKASAGEAAPQATVCQFLYGKEWAYTLEIDDAPVTTLTVAQPLLAKYHYTDAPPGVPAGKPLPLVGGSAVIVGSMGTHKNTVLQWEDIRRLQQAGWGVINHSYFHVGRTWGTPPEILTTEQFRRDLFWSQTVLALEVGQGRAPTHFVYPNGYMDYRNHLAEFGLHSGSRVSGSGSPSVYGQKADFYDMTRSYLDEGAWTNEWSKSDPMADFPKPGPAAGDVHVDFTHGISADPNSANYRRWIQRLDTIAGRYGQAGRDSLWSAPTGQILDYVTAARAAKVTVQAGKLTVELPDSIPGSRLTVMLKGIPAASALTAPAGATLYRQGDTAWITTPMIGQPGSPCPKPQVKRIYAGAIKDMAWDRPIRLAAVRLLQNAPPAKGFELQIDAVTPDGQIQSLLKPEERHLRDSWGTWLLYSTVPNQPAVSTRELRFQSDKALEKMEIWVVEE
jgi:Polysaccharide deacetylase